MNMYFMYRSKLAKPVYSDSSLDKLFCLTNKKYGNHLWQLGSVQKIYIFLRGHVSFQKFGCYKYNEYDTADFIFILGVYTRSMETIYLSLVHTEG